MRARSIAMNFIIGQEGLSFAPWPLNAQSESDENYADLEKSCVWTGKF